MKKLLKITGVTLGILLLVALVAPMALRGKISDIVKREANGMLAAKLDFERLNISLLRHFPHASVELKGLTLVGAGASRAIRSPRPRAFRLWSISCRCSATADSR